METDSWPPEARISIPLDRDDTGYPPAAWEGLWALHVSEDQYMIDSVPFFARNISLGDVIRVHRNGSDFQFVTLLKPSANTTIRVSASETYILEDVRKDVRQFGSDGEIDRESKLLALNVPPTASLEQLFDYLENGYAAKTLDFEESSVRYK